MSFRVITDYPIAVDSNDHLVPHGTAKDNHKNSLFNSNIEYLISKRPIKIMDLGCAGGGMIREFVEEGAIAIGLEGSDYCLQRKLREWKHIPDNLFTCDISRPFTVMDGDQPLKFHVITSWDVLEHMNDQERLDGVCQNIVNHLEPNGYFICSMPADEAPGTIDSEPVYGDPLYHHIHFSMEEWEQQFLKFGLIPKEFDWWLKNGWVRGDDHHCYRKILQKT